MCQPIGVPKDDGKDGEKIVGTAPKLHIYSVDSKHYNLSHTVPANNQNHEEINSNNALMYQPIGVPRDDEKDGEKIVGTALKFHIYSVDSKHYNLSHTVPANNQNHEEISSNNALMHQPISVPKDDGKDGEKIVGTAPK
jgi:hypothetical protein